MARSKASNAQDKARRCQEIEKACRSLKKVLFARFEHIGNDSSAYAKMVNASWEEKLNQDLHNLCRLINMQMAIRAKTLKCQAGLAVDQDRHNFNQALQLLFSQLLITPGCDLVEMTLAFHQLGDAVHTKYMEQRKSTFNITKAAEFQTFIQQLNSLGGNILKVVKAWQNKKFKSQLCYILSTLSVCLTI